MKCPNCGKWNQASLPHCIYCGQELPNDAYGPQGVPAWQLELEDRDRKNTYVRVDETGEQETTNDPRDTLASEMADLKSRKIMGEQKQRMLREEAARRGMAPSGRSVRTTSNRGTFFSAYDDPDTALRPVAPELVEEAVSLGFTSVMYDCSTLPFEENVRRIREMAKKAHAAGCSLEAEIGHVGSNGSAEEDIARSVYTRPEDALLCLMIVLAIDAAKCSAGNG